MWSGSEQVNALDPEALHIDAVGNLLGHVVAPLPVLFIIPEFPAYLIKAAFPAPGFVGSVRHLKKSDCLIQIQIHINKKCPAHTGCGNINHPQNIRKPSVLG